MRKSLDVIVLGFCVVLLMKSAAESYDNQVMHQSINESAAKQSTNLLATLKNIGFVNGLETVVSGLKIFKGGH